MIYRRETAASRALAASSRFRQMYSYFEERHPQLSRFFHDAGEQLANLAGLDDQSLLALQKLTLVSEFIYIESGPLLKHTLAKNELVAFADLLYAVSETSTRCADVLLKRYLTSRYPLISILQPAADLVRTCAGGAAEASSALDFCLSFTEEHQCHFMLEQLAIVARQAPIASELVDRLRALAALPWETLTQWLERGTGLITSNRVEDGVDFLRMRSKESRWLLGLKHVVLEDFKNVLKIYCASLAGREMEVVNLEVSSFGFSLPYTDGKAVFLPPEIGFFNGSDENERMYTALCALQAASISLGTYAFELKRIDFTAELLDRYGTRLPENLSTVRKHYRDVAQAVRERTPGEIEVVFPSGRALGVLHTDHERFFYSFPTPDFARELFLLVENARIEYQLSLKYSGLKTDFSVLNAYVAERRPALPPPGRDRYKQFQALLESLIQFVLVRRCKFRLGAEGLEKLFGAMTSTLDRVLLKAASVQDSAHACFALYNLFNDNYAIEVYADQKDIRAGFAGIDKQDMRPEVVREVSPELLATREERPQFDDLEEPEEQDVDLTAIEAIEKEQDRVRQGLTAGSLKLFRYPEYSIKSASYEPNHCTLFERALDTAPNDYCQEILKEHNATYKRIKKRFLAMRPEEAEISRRWASGDEIHLGDAVDYSIDVLRGVSPDERVYFRKIKSNRDVGVAILVDSSSSTDEVIHEKKIIEIEKAALALLASALALVGDSFSIYSFFSQGRNRVFFNIVKDFHEPWSELSKSRVAAIQAYASNRDGCAIRHATMRLEQQSNHTKLLILLSDGIPADKDYGSDSSADTSEYAIEDTRKAVLECKMKGIVPYCITIDRTAKSYVPHLYGDFHHVILDDVTRLPDKLARLYLRFTH